MKLYLVFLSLAALLTQAGCVTGQRALSVPVPTASAPVGPVIKGSIYISSVTDARAFQNKPSDPSIPSVNGDVGTMSAAQKDRMIGRQRNTFGMAMGDIALANDDSVTKRVRALVEEGLRRKGYEISHDPAASASIAVAVDEFWAWMTPGFWSLTFEAKVSSTLTLKNAQGSARLEIKGRGLTQGQVARDANWLEALQPAFEQFLTNLGAELDKAGLHQQ